MKRVLGLSVAIFLSVSACGSDDAGSGSGGGGGTGGGGTTCADGYPKLGSVCAVANEKCVSCPTGAPCCDWIECQSGAWVQTQFHTSCPSDGGLDATSEDAGDAGSDVLDEAASD